MLDLADAAAAPAPVYMLGGGNPARIAEVERVYRQRLVEIAADAAQFGRFAGQYRRLFGEKPSETLRRGRKIAEFIAR